MTLTMGNYNGNGWVIDPDNTDPVKTPTGLLATRALETKAGWIGQVVVDKQIVWESEPITGEDAQKLSIAEASSRVVDRLRMIFADT